MIRYSGAILYDGAKVLLGRRSPNKRVAANLWDIFGGHIEANETPEATMLRELDEELSIVPTDFKLIDLLAEDIDGDQPSELHVFLVTRWNGNIQNISDEHTEIAWFHPHSLPIHELASTKYIDLLASIGTVC